MENNNVIYCYQHLVHLNQAIKSLVRDLAKNLGGQQRYSIHGLTEGYLIW